MRLNSRMYVFNRINGLIIDNSKADKDFTVHNARHGFKTGVTYLLANVFNTAETREIVAKLEDGIKNSPYKNHISSVHVLSIFDTGVCSLPRPNISVTVYFNDSILRCSSLTLYNIEIL